MVEEVLPYKYDQCLRWGQQSDCLDNWEKQIENTKKIISLRNDKFLNEVKNYLNEKSKII
ncbi:unknown [Firmicutes bacterium CAG:449]|nr:unknown [Firmicutes bacterium CAG:449]